ncbi:MAG: hypothetical protein JKY00_11570, partial [Roseicyclus sp.]|nr:hypothetical protein [Roseicyclus sp.]
MWIKRASGIVVASSVFWAALAGVTLAKQGTIDATDLPPFGTPDWLSDTITRPHANIATDAS